MNLVSFQSALASVCGLCLADTRCASPRIMASSTLALSALQFRGHKICTRQWVAHWALGFACVLRGCTISPKHVSAVGDCLKVRYVVASPIAA